MTLDSNYLRKQIHARLLQLPELAVRLRRIHGFSPDAFLPDVIAKLDDNQLELIVKQINKEVRNVNNRT